MDKETLKKMQDFFNSMRFRQEMNDRYCGKGFGKTSLMLKHFQEIKNYYQIDKSDEEFIEELTKDGFVLIYPKLKN